MAKITSYPYNPSGSDTKSIGGIMSIFDHFKSIINALDDDNFASITRGSDSVTWPGDTTFSDSKVINHGLGAVPVAITVTPNHTDFHAREPNFGVYNITAESFTVAAALVQGSAVPAEGFLIKFGWVAML